MTKYAFLNTSLFKVEDIKDAFGTESTLFGNLKRLIDNGKIVKLKGGLYATINPLTNDIYANRFEIASILYHNSYIGYHSALEYYGLATQVYYDVHVITDKRYSPMIIDGLEYQFYYSNYKEGINEITRNSIIRVTELERTIIDCIDCLLLAGGIEEVFSAISMVTWCNEEKLLKHLAKYNKKILYKKVGYLFSLLKPSYLSDNFYLECKNKMSLRDDDIRENKVASYLYIKEWKLYVPKYNVNTEN